ncbi:MAG: methylated-DNA--[protein]-cysteine S-methyltransferase [Peptococcaceae bacterium]|nr:methylated-DNA--[protein]-cysteine S-methyltransferase [Peptococcaceae bacterium]
MKYYLDAEVSTGWILRIVEEREAIVQIHILRKPETAEADMDPRETALLLEAKRQLEEYFAGIRASFSLPLAPEGTEFQKSVWQQLEAIPFGETRTYGQIAAAAGNPKACRAAGGAIHKNPIAIMIPCHRVIGADGSLTGFASGLDVKEALLRLEGIIKE